MGISGFLAMPFVFFCCPILPLPFSVLGIYFGLQARREIEVNPALHAGAGQAKAGLVLGFAGVAVFAVLFFIVVAIIGVSIAAPGT